MKNNDVDMIIVKVDHNDADYVHEITMNPDVELVELCRKLVSAMDEAKKRLPYCNNWDYDRCEEYYDGLLTSDDIDYIRDAIIPFVDNGEVHTIESIKFYSINEVENL